LLSRIGESLPDCSCETAKLFRGRPQVAIGHDVVPLEHRPCLVARELHGYSFSRVDPVRVRRAE
jgi:hypothetical protein